MDLDLIIFDCDGVLVDNEPLRVSVMQDVLTRHGIAISNETLYETCVGRPCGSFFASLQRLINGPVPETAREHFRSDLLARFESELVVTPGLRSLLDGLTVPVCATSSSPLSALKRTLELAGLSDIFADRMFSVESVTRGLPAPDLYLQCAQQMAASPGRTLVVEDSVPGIAAAFAAGMQVAIYAGGSHIEPADLDDWDDVDVVRHWRDFPPIPRSASPTLPLH